jgi:catechol 2,3-dioxygenase-like lactoylglutathione lyase family enzyme
MRILLALLFIFATPMTAAWAQSPASTPRPKITGISHVAFYSDNREASRHFYGELLGLMRDPASTDVDLYRIGRQSIEIEPSTHPGDPHRIAHYAFATSDAEALRRYLQEHGVKVPPHIEQSGANRWFALKDPEDNPIEFVEEKPSLVIDGVSRHIIHAGFIVRDRAREDSFYRDILGFHLYWQGGMKDGITDFVDMQVPDGSDWLEYMLNQPANPDKFNLGVQNHFALGVPDIESAEEFLHKRGWKGTDKEKPKLGRDGKWQINLYDPDLIRVEIMTFRPVQKPCCSEYLTEHPGDVH